MEGKGIIKKGASGRIGLKSFYSVVSLLRNQLVTMEFGVESRGVHATTRDLAGNCCVYCMDLE